MPKISDGKIGIREFGALIIITLALKGTDTTPDFLIAIGKNSAWLVAFLAYLFMLVPLLIILHLINKHKQGLVELIFQLAGKWGGFIICTYLFFVVFSTAVLNSRSYVDIVNTLFYPKTSIVLLLFLLLATSYLIANRGLEALGRTAWLFMFWIHLMGIALIILVWQEMEWLQLFPIFGPGPKELLIESARYSSLYVEIIALATFFANVRNVKEYRLATLGGYTISMLWIVFCVVYIMIFDYPAARYLNFPYQQITRMTSIGITVSHLESVFLGFWIISSALHFAIYLYLAANLFAKTIRIHEFEPLILPLTGAILLLGVIPDNIVTLNQFRSVSITSASMIIFLFPFLLLLLDWWKGRMKNANS